jgi:hypothetical protein
MEQIAQVIADETGVRAVADPRQVVLPCVLVGPPDIEFTTNCGGMAEFPVSLMAAGPWNLDATAQLSQMLADVLGVEGIVPPASAKPGQMDVPDNGSVPVYRLVYRMVIDL